MQIKNFNTCFALRPSKIFIFSLCFISVLSLVLVEGLNLSLWARCLIGLLVILYTFFITWQQGLLFARDKIEMLAHMDHQAWVLITQAGKQMTAQLGGGSLVTPLLCILKFRLMDDQKFYKRRRKNIIIFCDALSKNDFRRLRVTLLYLSIP